MAIYPFQNGYLTSNTVDIADMIHGPWNIEP